MGGGGEGGARGGQRTRKGRSEVSTTKSPAPESRWAEAEATNEVGEQPGLGSWCEFSDSLGGGRLCFLIYFCYKVPVGTS